MEPRVDSQTIGLVMGDDAPSGVSTQITTRQTQNVGMELDEPFHAAGQEPNMFIHGVSVPEHQLRLQQVCIFLVLQQWQRNPEKNAGKRQKPAPLACFERCCDGNRNANCGQAEGHWCTRESSKVGDSAVRSLSFLSSNDRALKMIKIDKEYARALLSIWRMQWGKKPSLAELLEMNSFMCCHAEHFVRQNQSSSSESDNELQVETDARGPETSTSLDEAACVYCKDTWAVLATKAAKSRYTPFQGRQMLNHDVSIGWRCHKNSCLGRYRRDPNKVSRDPSPVAAMQCMPSTVPAPWRPLSADDSARIDSYVSGVETAVKEQAIRAENPSAVQKLLSKKLVERFDPVPQEREQEIADGKLAVQILKSAAPLLSASAKAHPGGGSVRHRR